MSRGARWTLGFFALAFAVCFLVSNWTTPSKSPLFDFLLPMFCTLIAMACFIQSWRSPAVRVIGALTFVATASYLIFELLNEPTKPYAKDSEPHWVNAILAMVSFGLPGLYVAVRGVYPTWGNGAQAFGGRVAPAQEKTVHDGVGWPVEDHNQWNKDSEWH